MTKALVTGANGFTGSELVKRLLDLGYEVNALIHHSDDRINHLLGNKNLVLYSSDNLDKAVTDVDAVFHLASFFSTKKDSEIDVKLIESNINFSIDLIKSVEKNSPNAWFVFASSFSVLDSTGEHLAPSTMYATTKAVTEDDVRTHLPNSTILRLSDSYGKNDPRNKIYRLVQKGIEKDNEFTFRSPDTEEMVLLNVSDVADAFIYSFENKVAGTYNMLFSRNLVTLGAVASAFLAEYPNASLQFPMNLGTSRLPVDVQLLPGFFPSHNPLEEIACIDRLDEV